MMDDLPAAAVRRTPTSRLNVFLAARFPFVWRSKPDDTVVLVANASVAL